MSDEPTKTDAEWREQLTPEQYHVTREKGTEPAFTGKYYRCEDDGIYRCVGCGAELFSSDAKYDSRTGWPSFHSTAVEGNVGVEEDTSHGMKRTEVHCNRCQAHLGHVFSDGPQPMGLRYCINSAALDLEKKE